MHTARDSIRITTAVLHFIGNHLVFIQLGDLHLQFELLVPPREFDHNLVAHVLAPHALREIIKIVHFVPVELDDDIASLDARTLGWGVRLDGHDLHDLLPFARPDSRSVTHPEVDSDRAVGLADQIEHVLDIV